MDFWEAMLPVGQDGSRALGALDRANGLGARYGLVLRGADMQMLVQRQREALQNTGRVEFGEGPYRDLITALCDSPHLTQASYADTLAECCELFYRMKSESAERWSDDELVDRIKTLFDGECQGSLPLVGDRLWQALHPPLGMEDEEEDDGEGEIYAQ